MNRLKLWMYLVLLLCAGAANMVGLSRWLTYRAIAQIDRELTRSVSQVDARSQLLAAEAAQLADAVARDPAVVRALSSEEASPGSAAQPAAQSARAAAGPASSQLVATAGRGGRTFTVDGAAVQPDPQLESMLSGSAEGAIRREGYVVVGDALYYAVATPAGRGAAVAVGVPMNAAWFALLRSGTGADVTLLLEQRPPRGTLLVQDAQLLAKALHGAAGPVDVGRLPSQPTSLGVPLPLLFANAPAYRAHPVALRGLAGGVLALSQPTGALLAPVIGYQWALLVGLVLLLIVGAGLGLTITNEQEAIVPKELVAAADRITRRDFTARAPVMAGSLGTVAAALNCAAEAARSAGEVRPAALAHEGAAGATPAAGDAGAPADVFSGFSPAPRPAEAAAAPEPEAAVSAPAAGDAGALADVFSGFSAAPCPTEAAAALEPEALAPAPAADDASASADVFAGFSPAPSLAEAAAAPEPEPTPTATADSSVSEPADLLAAFSRASRAAEAAAEQASRDAGTQAEASGELSPASPSETAAAPQTEGAENEPAAASALAEIFSGFSGTSLTADAAAAPEAGASETEPAAAQAFSLAGEPAVAQEPAAHAQPAGWPFTEEGPFAGSLATPSPEPAMLDAAAAERLVAALGEAAEPPATSELSASPELASPQEPAASPEPAPAPNVFAPAEAAGSALAAFAARLEQQATAHREQEPAPAPLPAAPAEPAPAVSAPQAPVVPPASGFDRPETTADEAHWRVTYDEFLKVREQCGESRQTVSYDRFRQKLQKNREQLVAKYGCRTVRFQVYVKEGRAALKASPVR